MLLFTCYCFCTLQVLYVYCMYLYKINTYIIDNNTTLSNLQFLIEKDTNISVNQQILTDYYGNILLNDIPVLAQINVRIIITQYIKCFYNLKMISLI